MKKYYLISGSVLLLGALLCLLGYCHQGFKAIASTDSTSPLLVLSDNPHNYSIKKSFSRADIDVQDIEVEIRLGSQYQVQVQSQQLLTVTVKQDKLQIKQLENNFPQTFQINNYKKSLGKSRPRLLITLPSKAALKSLNITAQAPVTISNLLMQQLHVSGEKSALFLQQTQIQQQATFNADANSIYLNNCQVHNLISTAHSSRLTIKQSQLQTMQLQADKLQGQILATEIKGKNKIQATKLNLNCYSDNPDLSLMINGDTTIYYHQKQYAGSLRRQKSTTNTLEISGDQGLIKIKD